jgi:hypothetical protein
MSSALVGAFIDQKTKRVSAAWSVRPIEQQHVKVPVEIERAAKALNQGDRAGARRRGREQQVQSIGHVQKTALPAGE